MLERSSNVKRPFPLRTERKIPLPHTPEGGFVTVCVAAIAGGGTCIYGACDRMLTSWDIQFEPQLDLTEVDDGVKQKPPGILKVLPLSNSVVAMIAGEDISALTQIIYELIEVVRQRIKTEPENWWLVRDVAYKYRDLWNAFKYRAIERTILGPYGLDYESFISRQKELSDAVVRDLSAKIDEFRLPNLSVIFAGVDTTGAHLYVARNGEIACEDLVGFAAIGSGNWHAESQFMSLGHTKDSALPRAVYLTYAAKRRAEIAPGVGKGTDMFYVGPALGTYNPIDVNIVREFEKTYTAARDSAKKIWEGEASAIQQLLDKMVLERAAAEKAKKGSQTPGDPAPTPTTGSST